MRNCALRGSAAVILLASIASGVQGQIQSGSISPAPQLKLIASGLTTKAGGSPDFGVNSGDPRFMYIGEQNGTIRILDFNQANPVSATNLLNIDSVLGADSNGNRVLVDDTGLGERGLIGAAFSPNFNNPGTAGYRKFYTFTSETLASGTPNFFNPLEPTASGNSNSNDPVQSGIPNGYNCQSVIREWTVNDPNANGLLTINTSVASRVVLRIAKPGRFHNGGGITFGGDGYLYIPLGDGGGGPSNGGNDGGNNTLDNGHTNPGNPDIAGAWTGQGNAQDRRVVYGKILRIKPTTDTSDGNSTTTLTPTVSIAFPTTTHLPLRLLIRTATLSMRFMPTVFAIRFALVSTRPTRQSFTQPMSDKIATLFPAKKSTALSKAATTAGLSNRERRPTPTRRAIRLRSR